MMHVKLRVANTQWCPCKLSPAREDKKMKSKNLVGMFWIVSSMADLYSANALHPFWPKPCSYIFDRAHDPCKSGHSGPWVLVNNLLHICNHETHPIHWFVNPGKGQVLWSSLVSQSFLWHTKDTEKPHFQHVACLLAALVTLSLCSLVSTSL